LLTAARQIGPALAARVEADEANGTLTAETVALLEDAGMFRLKLPRELGGHEADPATQILVLEELARANMAAAWCTMVGATSLAQSGAFLPEDGIAEVFPGGHVPRGATVAMPTGKAEPVPGGYRLTGRWSFASGVRHSDWIVTAAPVQKDGKREMRRFVLPTGEAELRDNWHVVGLKGTGSCDFSVDDLFVPDARTWDNLRDQAKRGGPLYRIGMPGFVANEHAGVALGLARSALDRFIEKEASRTRSYVPGGSSIAGRGVIQDALGRMELKLRAARLLAIDTNEAAWKTLEAGGDLSVQQQCELRAAATYATEVAVAIISAVFRHSGGSAIYEQNALQQMLRDINVAAQHRMVSEAAYENLGQALVGLPDVNPMR
jgi:indole-3-acetate monooxygenase